MEKRQLLEMLETLLANNKEYCRLCDIFLAKKQTTDGLIAIRDAKKPRVRLFGIIFGSLLILLAIIIFGVAVKKVQLMGGFIFVGLIPIAISIIVTCAKRSKWKKNVAAAVAALPAATIEMNDAENAAKSYFDGTFSPFVALIVPEKFPERYVYDQETIEMMIVYVRDHRSDSVKEALNLCAQEKAISAICNLLAGIDTNTGATAKYSKESAENTAKAARAATATAVATSITAFNTAVIAHNTRN